MKEYKLLAHGASIAQDINPDQNEKLLASKLGAASCYFGRHNVPKYRKLNDQKVPCSPFVDGTLRAEGKRPRFYYPIPVASSRTFANIPV